MARTCETCIYRDIIMGGDPTLDEQVEPTMICRRYPPVPFWDGTVGEGVYQHLVVVSADTWCGEYSSG